MCNNEKSCGVLSLALKIRFNRIVSHIQIMTMSSTKTRRELCHKKSVVSIFLHYITYDIIADNIAFLFRSLLTLLSSQSRATRNDIDSTG
jgi:hypothetical protein